MKSKKVRKNVQHEDAALKVTMRFFAEELRRFRSYEAVTSYQNGVPVTTYVLYSGKIKNPMTELTEGVNTYKVIPVIMRDKNAGSILEEFR